MWVTTESGTLVNLTGASKIYIHQELDPRNPSTFDVVCTFPADPAPTVIGTFRNRREATAFLEQLGSQLRTTGQP